MKRLSLFAIALALVAAGCSKSSTAPTTTTPTKPTFTAALSTANEVPPITGVEAGGTGNATMTFDLTKDAAGNVTAASVTFVVNISGLPPGTPINIAHIHEGAAGVAGSVRVATTLTAATAVILTNGSGSFTNTQPVVDPALAQTIINNPAGYYFNAHSTINGGGVVRGQLVKVQ
jgi:CHRD domain